MSSLAAWGRALVDLVIPPVCLGCRTLLSEEEEDLCAGCLDGLALYGADSCGRCARAARESGGPLGRCPGCAGEEWVTDGASSVGPYRGDLREILHRLKFGGQRLLARPLGRLLATRVEEEDATAVVPIPADPLRVRERGYDQALLIAQELAGVTGVPVERKLLRREPGRPPQTGLPRSKRVENVRGVFALGAKARLEGARILLVDDVLTTGATAAEACRVLRRGGAARIHLVTVARTERLP